MALFEEGAEQGRDRSKKRAGIPAKRVAEVIKKGGRLSEAVTPERLPYSSSDGSTRSREGNQGQLAFWSTHCT